MATITITYVDNGDGSVSITNPGPTGSAAEKVTTKSLTEACNVARGWIQQSMPLVALQ